MIYQRKSAYRIYCGLPSPAESGHLRSTAISAADRTLAALADLARETTGGTATGMRPAQQAAMSVRT